MEKVATFGSRLPGLSRTSQSGTASGEQSSPAQRAGGQTSPSRSVGERLAGG